ncbi:PRA1 FAMILY PROTEIN G2 [Salix purpurea]|uniref:PRA1 family protein n=1 Tax=Salix purpurea TaxID=77065 RepID=A0A9Q1A0E5_SALPP|nr:PRA1 FAMILY PROTEIN G2 [Salix purpurea]
MSHPPPPSTTTYTTIPISAGDVISRSLQNFTSSFSILRPWPELFTSGSFTRPDSFATALTQLRANFHYFRVNYLIIISACGALSLIGSPVSLLIFASVLSLWLLLYFFREDPLVESDWNLVWGVLIGFLVCAAHAFLRNSDGLLVANEEAALVGSGYVSGSYGALSASGDGGGQFIK